MGIVVPLISACMTWPPHGQRSAPQWRRLLVKILGREPWIGTYGVCGLLALCRYPARPSVLLSPSVLLGRRELTGSPAAARRACLGLGETQPAVGVGYDGRVEVAGQLGLPRREGFGVRGRQRGEPVRGGQVPDLISDGPARRGRGQLALVVADSWDHPVQGI